MDCKSKSNTSCMHLCENDTILHDVFTGVMWVRKKWKQTRFTKEVMGMTDSC